MNAKKSNFWKESLEEGFLAWIEKHGYSEKTRKTYQSMIFSYFTFLENNNIPYKNSNKTTVEQFFKERAVGDKTKQTYLWLISDIFDDMVECGFLDENNMAIVLEKKRLAMRGKVAKRVPTVLTESQVNILYQYIASLPRNYQAQRKRCALLLLLNVGLRAEELCLLKTANMHLDNNPPHLSVIGKFDKERIVPVPESIIDELKEFKELKVRQSQYFLSSMASGNPYTPSGVYCLVKLALSEAGIVMAKMSPHVLRHTYCTTQLANGVPLEVVKNWMGHESIATTAIYEHVVTSLHSAKPFSAMPKESENV